MRDGSAQGPPHYFVDAERQWGKALVGLDSSEASRDASFCARAIARKDGLLIAPDTLGDREWSSNHQVVGDPGLRFYAETALATGHGHAIARCASPTIVAQESLISARSTRSTPWPARPSPAGDLVAPLPGTSSSSSAPSSRTPRIMPAQLHSLAPPFARLHAPSGGVRTA